MIDLQVPRNTVWIVEIVWRGVEKQPWSIDWSQAIGGERRDHETLILLKRSDIQWNLVVKETDTASHDCLIGISRSHSKPDARREVVVLSDSIAVVTETEIKNNT